MNVLYVQHSQQLQSCKKFQSEFVFQQGSTVCVDVETKCHLSSVVFFLGNNVKNNNNHSATRRSTLQRTSLYLNTTEPFFNLKYINYLCFYYMNRYLADNKCIHTSTFYRFTLYIIFLHRACPSTNIQTAFPSRDCIKTHFDLTFLAVGGLTQRSIPER